MLETTMMLGRRRMRRKKMKIIVLRPGSLLDPMSLLMLAGEKHSTWYLHHWAAGVLEDGVRVVRDHRDKATDADHQAPCQLHCAVHQQQSHQLHPSPGEHYQTEQGEPDTEPGDSGADPQKWECSDKTKTDLPYHQSKQFYATFVMIFLDINNFIDN